MSKSKRQKSRENPMNVTALASWYGSNRMLAEHVGKELSGCAWVGVPFAGGMCELVHIGARSLLVNDIHQHQINLARVTGHPVMGPKLYRTLKRLAYHPQTLQRAQERCELREDLKDDPDGLFASGMPDPRFEKGPDVEWAADYFVCAWMSRHGSAGTKTEFKAPISLRWNAGGGDSAAHYMGAVRSLVAWRRVFRRCNFTTLDFREFLDQCKDEPGHGIYSDSPFPGPGDRYKYPFTTSDQEALADKLKRFRQARVVCRFYDHPLIARLYPEGKGWTWVRRVGRTQTNDDAAEVLIINGPSYAAGVVA